MGKRAALIERAPRDGANLGRTFQHKGLNHREAQSMSSVQCNYKSRYGFLPLSVHDHLSRGPSALRIKDLDLSFVQRSLSLSLSLALAPSLPRCLAPLRLCFALVQGPRRRPCSHRHTSLRLFRPLFLAVFLFVVAHGDRRRHLA